MFSNGQVILQSALAKKTTDIYVYRWYNAHIARVINKKKTPHRKVRVLIIISHLSTKKED